MLKLIGPHNNQSAPFASSAADDAYSVINFPDPTQTQGELVIRAARIKRFAQSHLDDLSSVGAFLHHDLFIQSLIAEEIVRFTATTCA